MTGVARGGIGDTSYIASVHSDGNHRVPNVNRNSDGDFKFNLGNFENDWDSDNCLLCFCNSLIFLPLFIVSGSFFLKAFLPSSEHSSHFVQLEDELSVRSVVEHFMLPPDLEKEF